MSRIMLALKTTCAGGEITTMVFDEIDAGVGGETAHRVAAELAELALHRQVLVVTHLAQLAARAQRQLVVEKILQAGRPEVMAGPVKGEARVAELARMLSGFPDSASARTHAAELLRQGGGLQ